MFPCRIAATPKNESDHRVVGIMFRCRFVSLRGDTQEQKRPPRGRNYVSVSLRGDTQKRSPTAFFGGTPKKLKNETIRSTSMSPIRKRNCTSSQQLGCGVGELRAPGAGRRAPDPKPQVRLRGDIFSLHSRRPHFLSLAFHYKCSRHQILCV